MKNIIQHVAGLFGYQKTTAPIWTDSEMPVILLGTYHKTGTVWMESIFKEISLRTGRAWLDLSQKCWREEDRMLGEMKSAKSGSIIFQHHTIYPKLKPSRSYCGLRMIRDPRDVVLSSLRYHRKSDEEWLHVSQEKFNGKTYQERLNEITDPLQAFDFELKHIAGRTITEMQKFKNTDIFKTIKYEDMISDSKMIRWFQVFVDLGFQGEELIECLTAVWKHSLFGKKGTESQHIIDGSIGQWKEQYTSEMFKSFDKAFPDACKVLNYK